MHRSEAEPNGQPDGSMTGLVSPLVGRQAELAALLGLGEAVRAGLDHRRARSGQDAPAGRMAVCRSSRGRQPTAALGQRGLPLRQPGAGLSPAAQPAALSHRRPGDDQRTRHPRSAICSCPGPVCFRRGRRG